MRFLSAAILVLGLPAAGAAQSSMSALAPLPPLPPIGLPLPSITSPLAPIGLPLSTIGLPPHTGTRPRGGHEPSRARERDHAPFDPRRNFRAQPTFVYMVPIYGWGIQQPVVVEPVVVAPSIVAAPYASPAPAKDERPAGVLRLELEAAEAALQLYVDGYFVGTPDEINRELMLEAGPHRIEIRAPGYETITFDVRIDAYRSITYRAALQRVAAEPKPSIDPRAGPAHAAPQLTPTVVPSTFYFIPGCYIGNVPPEKVELPATCDMSRLIIRKP
jgi:hypothetical protein